MSRPRILVVDDDLGFAGDVRDALTGVYDVERCATIQGFRDRFRVGRYALIVMDMRLEV